MDEQERAAAAALAVLWFRPGTRPSGEELERLARIAGFTVVSVAGNAGTSVELLRQGLIFELSGLAPGIAAQVAAPVHRFGLPEHFHHALLEPVALRPGSHIAGAMHLAPVVRAAVQFVADLLELAGVAAVSWCPAGNVMGAERFSAHVGKWLAGGPFPVLALVSLFRRDDGCLGSRGLNLLTGLEFRLAHFSQGESSANMALAIRIADWLVLQGRFDAPCMAAIPGVGEVRFEIEPRGEIIVRPGGAQDR